MDVLYTLLGDIVRLFHGSTGLRNEDIEAELRKLAGKVSFEWLRAALERVDNLVELARRNIQKSIALDALAVELRSR